MKRLCLWLAAALGVATGTLWTMRDAAACGCFTPPDPTVPLVQAGERILFAMESGKVTAHIQIQYSGNAGEFGWILPLPSEPTLELGTDELFNQLVNTTQPKYRLARVYEGNCFGRGAFETGDTANSTGGGPAVPGGKDNTGSVLVIQASIGPYDYAVLKADRKDEMLAWLAENHYFVPAGTDDAVGPYIHKGSFFLALKLRSGQATGDLQPVVVKYASDLPMIPIVLTSVAAQPDMGIQVWVLGRGRAIPRNYFHTVLNDALIDWFTAGQNYNDLVVKATREAEGRHTFVTEYAGPASVMQNILDAPGRFGSIAELGTQPDAATFVRYLNQHGYVTFSTASGPGPIAQRPVYSSQLLSILGRYIPVPAKLTVAPADFYSNIEYYLGAFRTQNPAAFEGWQLDYRPTVIAGEINERVVKPTLAAGALFNQYAYLTRLYTTLSPENMNRDPVFSENLGLPQVSNIHNATLTYHCGLLGNEDLTKTSASLKTEQGWKVEYPNGVGPSGNPPPINVPLPASQRIETITEEGPPKVILDNGPVIGDLLDDGGCSVGGHGRGAAGTALLLGLGLILKRRKKT